MHRSVMLSIATFMNIADNKGGNVAMVPTQVLVQKRINNTTSAMTLGLRSYILYYKLLGAGME
jgi:hypothetical protein